jgi:hypothetical protein
LGEPERCGRDPAVLLGGSAISARPIAINRRRLVMKKARRAVEVEKPAVPSL